MGGNSQNFTESLCFLYEYLDMVKRRSRARPRVYYRRLEDKIRHLCSLAVDAKNEDAWLILSELRILLSQHVEHLRTVAAGKSFGVLFYLRPCLQFGMTCEFRRAGPGLI